MEAQQEEVDGYAVRRSSELSRRSRDARTATRALGHEGLACRIHGSRLSTSIAIAREDQNMDFARSEGARPPTRMSAVRARIPSLSGGGRIEPRTTGPAVNYGPRNRARTTLDYPENAAVSVPSDEADT